ncbi:MAG TPA: trehalose-6-phosphate synthase, partial [Actinomycetota bacterium]|nr:trehalose-6-phosphate synthase [Actinomycetota bacterium]
MASNRGPVAFEEVDGELVPRRGSGGLVTGLTSALQETGGRWVAAALTEGDRARAAEGAFTAEAEGAAYDLRYLAIEPERFENHYNGFANRVLWFCHHYLWDLWRTPSFGPETERWWAAYRAVNAEFADALAAEAAAAGGAPAVLVQDYHLCLLPALLRERARRVRVA